MPSFNIIFIAKNIVELLSCTSFHRMSKFIFEAPCLPSSASQCQCSSVAAWQSRDVPRSCQGFVWLLRVPT